MIEIRVQIDTAGLDAITAGLTSAQGVVESGPIADMYRQWGRRTEAFTRKRFDEFSRGGGDWPALALSTIRARTGAAKGTKKPTPGFTFNVRGKGGNPLTGRGSRSSLARDTDLGKRASIDNWETRTTRLVSAGRTVSILRDTGTLFNALTIGAPGSTFEMIPGGFVYGVAGSAPHPPRTPAASIAKAAGAPLSLNARTATKAPTGKRKGSGAGGSKTVTIGDIAGFHQEGGKHLPKREIVVVPDQSTLDAMAQDAVRAIVRIGSSGAGGGAV